jgi:phosphoribosyl 1,2-cyclic phosphodiesterase
LQPSLFDLDEPDSSSTLRPARPEPPASARPPRKHADAPLRLVVLGSGSGGNAVVVEACGRRLLIDAGFSCRELERRMRERGLDPRTLNAVVLTHEHEDHCRGIDLLCRRYDLPVLATAGTLEGIPLSEKARQKTVTIRSGEIREVAGFAVEAFLIPHDAREPVGLVVEDPCGRRVGLVADLGSRSRLAWGRLSDLDLLILETNHDLEMLRSGPYPWSLKQRVASRHGHLSNEDAAQGVPELLSDRLRWLVLYHLSRTNNLPALALAAVGEALAREGSHAQLALTEQDRPTPWMEVP